MLVELQVVKISFRTAYTSLNYVCTTPRTHTTRSPISRVDYMHVTVLCVSTDREVIRRKSKSGVVVKEICGFKGGAAPLYRSIVTSLTDLNSVCLALLNC